MRSVAPPRQAAIEEPRGEAFQLVALWMAGCHVEDMLAAWVEDMLAA
jgi:hypothetical protein